MRDPKAATPSTGDHITPLAVARSLGLGVFAGALFVATAMVVEQTLINSFAGSFRRK